MNTSTVVTGHTVYFDKSSLAELINRFPPPRFCPRHRSRWSYVSPGQIFNTGNISFLLLLLFFLFIFQAYFFCVFRAQFTTSTPQVSDKTHFRNYITLTTAVRKSIHLSRTHTVSKKKRLHSFIIYYQHRKLF